MEDYFDINAAITFLMAAKDAGEAQVADVSYEFTCTNCGEQAVAVIEGRNRHVHARCSHCGMNIME